MTKRFALNTKVIVDSPGSDYHGKTGLTGSTRNGECFAGSIRGSNYFSQRVFLLDSQTAVWFNPRELKEFVDNG